MTVSRLHRNLRRKSVILLLSKQLNDIFGIFPLISSTASCLCIVYWSLPLGLNYQPLYGKRDWKREIGGNQALLSVYCDLKSNYLSSCRDVPIFFTGYLLPWITFTWAFSSLFGFDTVAEKREKKYNNLIFICYLTIGRYLNSYDVYLWILSYCRSFL